MAVATSVSTGDLSLHVAPQDYAHPRPKTMTETLGVQKENTTALAQWLLHLHHHPVECGLIVGALEEYSNGGQVSAALARRLVLGRLFDMPTKPAFFAFICANTVFNLINDHPEAIAWRGSMLVVLGAVMLSASACFAFHALATAHLLLRTAFNAFRSRPVLPPALVLRRVRPTIWPLFYIAMPVPYADEIQTLRSLFRGVLDDTPQDPKAHAVFLRILELQAAAGPNPLWHRYSHTVRVAAMVCLVADVLRRVVVAALEPDLDGLVFGLTSLVGNLLFIIACLTSLPLLCLYALYRRADGA